MSVEFKDSFNCSHCGKCVSTNGFIGTKNRNHCPFCLWSKHVDNKVAGDRKAICLGNMQPVGLTQKQIGQDKYGRDKQGELMLIHICTRCGKISINRIASDDDSKDILKLLTFKDLHPEEAQHLSKSQIKILNENNKQQVETVLFGKSI